MKKIILSKGLNYAIWGLFLCVVFPIIGLAYYNHPSVADDYCFARVTRDFGFWQGQKFYYEGWSGRYIANMLFHATPLAYGQFWFVKIMPLLVLVLTLHANYFLWKAIFPALSRATHWSMSLLFNSFFILQMPSLVDHFYWYSSVFIYPFSMAYWQYFMAYTIWYYEPSHRQNKTLVAVFMATMVFFIVGSNELMLLFINCFVAIIFGYQLLFQRKFNGLFLILLLVGIASAMIVLKAPGNEVRMHGDGLMGAGIERAIRSTFQTFANWTVQWVFKTHLILLTLFLIYTLRQYKGTFHPIFSIPLWVGLLAWIGLTLLMIFAIHYGNNLGVPTRVSNVIFEFFVLGWCFNITLLLAKGIFFKDPSPPLSWGLLGGVIILVLAFVKSPNMKIAYKELLKGKAKGYDQEMLARYEQIRTSKSDTIYIAPLKNQPTTLYFDEIKNTEKHLWNKCYAEYFGKKVIILKVQ